MTSTANGDDSVKNDYKALSDAPTELKSRDKSKGKSQPKYKQHVKHTPLNERIGNKFNSFWLYRVGLRCGYSKIRTFMVAEVLFWIFCMFVFGLAAYLVICSFKLGHPSSVPITSGFAIHSGLLTGAFYAMVIFLSLRFPFYWKWGLFMMGFDRQMIFHRYCAILGAITCVFHVVDNYKVIYQYKALTGWGCYAFALLLLVFARNKIRRKHYNSIFLYSHWLFIIGFIVFGWLHNAILIIYGTFIIVIDVILRILDNQCRSTKITNIKLLDYDRVIKLEFEKKHFSYKAGQYVFIRIPDLGFFEFHPFSLSSYPSSGKTLSLHIKSSVGGAWTDKLAVYAKLNENRPEDWKNIKLQVEGPFGELTLSKELYRYEHVIFIGGGIGVTPLDSMFNELVTDLTSHRLSKMAETKRIDFIFTTRSRSLITEFASRNKAWQIAESQEEKAKEDRKSVHDAVSGAIRDVHLMEVEAYQFARHNRRVLQGKLDLLRHGGSISDADGKGPGLYKNPSLLLDSQDIEIGQAKTAKLKFTKVKTNESDDEDEDGQKQIGGLESLGVDELEIENSTHITRVKDKALRKLFRETFPFINFQRPNIRAIIYGAASKTTSKNICVLTSGPKPMIEDCKKWGAELGIDVHFEGFDW